MRGSVIRDVHLPLDLVIGGVPSERECNTDYAEDLREQLKGIHEQAQHALDVNTRWQKRNYDRSKCGPVYRPGQVVWLYD